jgi:hypothetical protein
MAEIPNFPDYLHTRHTNWHMNPGHPEIGGRKYLAGTAGSGQEFLDFHHQFLIDFHLWYDVQPGADLALVAPWSAIPAELKAGEWVIDINAFEAQVNNTGAFATEDALGLYIEPVHNTGHGVMASVYNDGLVGPIMTSPRSSHFYNWHGLIDKWRNQWVHAHKHLKDLLDVHPKGIKELLDTPSKHTKDLLDAHPKGIKEQLDALSPKAIKDAADTVPVGGFGFPGGDPEVLIGQLARRVTELEIQLEAGKHFIRESERPKMKK